MTDPTDEELLEFMVGFVGKNRPGLHFPIPDYLHSVDAFIQDCFPKIREKMLEHRWANALQLHCTGAIDAFIACASARERCLALWRVVQRVASEQSVQKSQNGVS